MHKVLALVHSHNNNTCGPSCAHMRPSCARTKLCNTPPIMQNSLWTCGQAVLQASKVCNTRPSCATHCRCQIHCADAAKLCYTLQMRNSLCTSGQGVLHAAKVCNTQPSCATHCKCKIHCAHVAKVCNTLQRCATRSQAVLHAANAKFNVHTRPRCAMLEGVSTGGWCAYNLGMGPEYPGLDESEEYASWSILHWCSRLEQ
jgi:hypothetical protein